MSAVCSLLLLSLMLHISEEQRFFVVKHGDNVTLQCGNASLTHCTWNVEDDHNSVVLASKVRTRRLSIRPPVVVTQVIRHFEEFKSCELQIQHLTKWDAGVYTCTQLNQTQVSSEVNQTKLSSEVNQTQHFFLSVVTFSDKGLMSSKTLTCDFTPYDGQKNCGHLVKWRVQGSDHNQLTFVTSQCSARVYPVSPSSPNLSCEVTDLNRNQVYVFAANGDAQGNQTQVQTENEPEESQGNLFDSNGPGRNPHPVVTVLMLLMRSVELLMVSVITVILFRVHACYRSLNYRQVSKRTRQVGKNKNLNTRVEESLV
ncbi:uncharacterized protein LOC129411818 [Boleophthalmus pectinirostris]|uniref:uncharacterized protein LOC129411818 n=1 Tax=Boleophthalmus pectinirostris TaxID=150288 RepID=UPI00242D0BBB|nr:uncharacterized protein LOC129411818 [Boleophthalmus pectinirostris]